MFDADFNDTFIDEPLDEYIIFERNHNFVSTNVPHLILHHSQTGYEWGNHGDGAADLSLNIIENLLRAIGFEGRTMIDTWSRNRVFTKSWALHQEFKQTVIARMPYEGGKLFVNEVIVWIQEHLYD